jgi:hypothetical protein
MRQFVSALRAAAQKPVWDQPDLLPLEIGFKPSVYFNSAIALGFAPLAAIFLASYAMRWALSFPPRDIKALIEKALAADRLISRLPFIIAYLSSVYDVLWARNQVMVDNLAKILQDDRFHSVAFPMGAAHLPGIERLLKERFEMTPGNFDAEG